MADGGRTKGRGERVDQGQFGAQAGVFSCTVYWISCFYVVGVVVDCVICLAEVESYEDLLQ